MAWRCAAVFTFVLPVVAQLPALDFARLKPDATLAVQLESGAAVGPDGLWIPQRQRKGVVHVSATNNSPGEPIALAHAPCASLAIAFESVWAAACDGTPTSRISIAHGNVSPGIPLAIAEPNGSIASAAGSIWLATDAKGVVSRIDPATNLPVAEVYVAGNPFAVAAQDAVLWVTSEAGDTLTRIDAHTNLVVETIKVGPRPGPLAIGDDAVWTLNRGDGSVSRVDLKTNKVVHTIKVDASISQGTIAVGEDAVWLSAPGVPLVRIDPRSNRVTHKFTGEAGGAVVVGHGSVWVNAAPDVTWRIDPKLVAAIRP